MQLNYFEILTELLDVHKHYSMTYDRSNAAITSWNAHEFLTIGEQMSFCNERKAEKKPTAENKRTKGI